MSRKNRKPRKFSLMALKKWVTLEDWRAMLALIITVGGIVLMYASIREGADVATVTVPSVMALMTMVLQWYFKSRSDHE